jgi:hypothetical protein
LARQHLAHHAVGGSEQHVLHLHGLDHGHTLTRLHLLAGLHRHLHQQAGHGRQHIPAHVGRRLVRHQRVQLGRARRQHQRVELGAVVDDADGQRVARRAALHLRGEGLAVDRAAMRSPPRCQLLQIS